MMKPCPTCQKQPELVIDKEGNFILECARHGHIAMGASEAQAIDHWNLYISFVEKAVA